MTPSISSQLLYNGQHVILSQDQILLPVDLDLGPPIFGEQDPISRLDVQGDLRPVFLDLPRANGYHFPLEGVLFRRIRYDDSSLGLLLFFQSPHYQPIMKWSNFHKTETSFPEFIRQINHHTLDCQGRPQR